MQAITAMAHLRAAVLYVVDLSEQCGYALEQQAALFHSLKPLFANKPTLIVANKTDAAPWGALAPAQQQLVRDMAAEAARLSAGSVSAGAGASDGAGADAEAEKHLLFMSTLQEQGVQAVKNTACDRLLAAREAVKVQSKRAGDVANRLHVAVPKPRDTVARPPCIPASVLAERAAAAPSSSAVAAGATAAGAAKRGRKTERDLQEEHGGAGVYSADLRKAYQLQNEAWRYDIMPEIVDGHNVADFVDADIEAKLAELEREEAVLEVRRVRRVAVCAISRPSRSCVAHLCGATLSCTEHPGHVFPRPGRVFP